MGLLGGLGIGTSVGTPWFFWALVVLAVAVVIAIGIGMETLIAAGRTRRERVYAVTDCSIHGHSYAVNHGGWECVTCHELVTQDDAFDGAMKAVTPNPTAGRARELAGGRRG